MRGGRKMPRKRKCEVLVESLSNCTDYEAIRSDLLEQLNSRGSPGRFFTDLVEDYMDLWITKNMLLDDIKSRGVTVRYNNGGGQSGYKKNDSIEQVLKVNMQMLRILDKLELKPSMAAGEDYDEL